jgi:glutamyl-tRNA reductase
MIASPNASAPSRPQPPQRCCAVSVQAAILVYPSPCESAVDALCPEAAQQAHTLQRGLPRGWKILSATLSDAGKVLAEAAALQPARLILLAMPGIDAADLSAVLDSAGIERERVEVRAGWFDEASLVDAHARHIHAVAAARALSPASAFLVLRIPADDAQPGTAWRTVAEMIGARLGWPASALRIDTRAGGDWPETPACRPELVHDLDLAATPSEPGDSDQRIHCGPLPLQSMTCVLNSLVRRGRHPVNPAATRSSALFSWGCRGRERSLAPRLVMIGISVRGALGCGQGPALKYCSKDTFSLYKRSHVEVLDFLSGLRGGLFTEALIWNTCNRLELFAWLHPEAREEEGRRAIEFATKQLLCDASVHANVLSGMQAHQHLHRSAAGMNSTLAGDAEVLDQLQSAVRTSAHVGMGGDRCEAILDDAMTMVQRLRRQTSWGAYAHRYCSAALERLRPRLWNGVTPRRAVVVGGSTTAASVLETLAGDFGLSHDSLSLVYRGQRSGALTRRLENAIGAGRTVNVDCYADPALVGEVAAADAVFLAGDHREPILCGHTLREARTRAGHHTHPLTIVDFNTFPSTAGLEAVEGARLLNAVEIDQAIQSFNSDVLAQPAFARALGEAEDLIAHHTGAACAAARQEMVHS